MRLTVLGNTGRYLAPLSGGSSYLLEGGGARVLLDCGGGARAALARLEEKKIDAVVLSHFHFDHVLDFPTMRDGFTPQTTFFLPAGERVRLDSLAEAYAFRGGRTLEEAAHSGVPPGTYDLPGPVVEVQSGMRAGVKSLHFAFAPTVHSAPSFATRIDLGTRSFVYASDSAPCDALVDLARDADLLLMHTLLPTVDPKSSHAKVHSTAETAAKLASRAGAKRLLLSHRYWESPDAAMREAAATHHANVELARDEMSYAV